MRNIMAAALAMLLAANALAHHSTVMFDEQKEVTVTGVVKEFQYTNPHSWLLVDVKNDDGSMTTWGFEAEGPSTLMRAGIRPSDLKPGTELTITGHPMKDGRPAAAWVRATRGDGKDFDPRAGFAIK
jgi:Family of unknown function (DUF6152)